MTTLIKRTLATVVATSLSFAGLVQAAPFTPAPGAPELIGTEQAAAAQPGRALLEQTLSRADVVAALQARGVGIDAARARVAALTDAEAAQVAAQIDQAPAGGDVLGVIVTIFVVLLITDILGFTKIFPFTRSIR
jgi:uncharacterized protein DUF6627